MPPPPNAIITALPVSAADLPQAADLRLAPRIALVIGNNEYHAPWSQLRLAENDADSVASALNRRGFTLVGGSVQRNVSAHRFQELVEATERAVRSNPGAIIVVYFSGHGFVDHGRNYLAPTDAPNLQNAANSSINVIDMAQRLKNAGSGLVAMWLDACRSYGDGQAGGMADEPTPDNVFIGFAAQFGTIALESSAGGHGYYTSALLEALDQGFGRFDDMHLAISNVVVSRTSTTQVPVFREGVQMPETPVRLASNDVQTAFALAARRGTGTNLDAQRCAAQSDLRMIFSGPDVERSWAGYRYLVGPSYEAVDLRSIARSCGAAYANGSRDIHVLRGIALSRALDASPQPATVGNKPDERIALIAQAAENGDPVSNYMLGVSAAKSSYGLSFDLVKPMLLRAAKGADPTLTGFVSLYLWGPYGADFRKNALMPEDRESGLRFFRQAVTDGDPFAVQVAYVMKLQHDNAIAGLPLRDSLHRAIQNGHEFGLYFPGSTVHRNLYFLAIVDGLATKDWGEFASIVAQADPFLDELLDAADRASNIPSIPPGAMRMLAGCVIASGQGFEGQPTGIAPSPRVGIALLQRAVEKGFSNAGPNLARLKQGLKCV